jgi:hypothetical protein
MAKTVRLTHIDGKLPNLALMKLAHWHGQQGDEVHFSRFVQPQLWEPNYDTVYGSAIFSWSRPKLQELQDAWPKARIGGTALDTWETVEGVIGEPEYEHYDYSIYPEFPYSLGFTQRGCRLKCGFCVVPQKEGSVRGINTIADIWRPGTPKCVVLLDNDFFGQDSWKDRLDEIRDGDFRVSFNQGINIRMITPETAQAIASVRYSDDQFKQRRIYTAWDNLGQEKVFFRGLAMLNEAGIPSKHVMVYMLIGYAPGETMEDILHRFNQLVDAGCIPYPMVYNNQNKELKVFQRWVIQRYYQFVPWHEYNPALSHGRKS